MTALVELARISKSFGATRALDGVSLTLFASEVHVLAGSNGAGKSTLIRILSGAHRSFEGELRVNGKPVRFAEPRDALRAGIATIHQELSLVGSLSIADNLFLPERGAMFAPRRKRLAEARAILGAFELDLDPEMPLERLSLAARQLVEIARAVASGARVIIMDEPTSALGEREAARLFARIAALRAAGCALLYISHRMEEIARLADRISVLRDGRLVASARAMSSEELVRHLVGRELFALGVSAPPGSEVALEARSIRAVDDRVRLEGVDLRVRRGEVVGLYGLEGSGASLLLYALFGALACEGSIELHGRPFDPSPSRSIAAGMILVAGDRARSLVGTASVRVNGSLSALPRYGRAFIRLAEERAAVTTMTGLLGVSMPSLDAPMGQLSGGNQQKVALARALLTEPSVLLLDEPTRGIDVAAKRDVHALVREHSRRGLAVAMVSSELDELMTLCHRIVVLVRGRVAAVVDREGMDRGAIVALAMGGAS